MNITCSSCSSVRCLQCKYRYKQAIKEAADDESKNMNDSLFNHLCDKDNVSFWKSWRKQFCSRNIQPTNLLNGKNGTEILPEFTKYYTCVFQSYTANADAKFKVDVDSILAGQPRCMSDGIPMIDIGDMITISVN